MDMLLPFEDRVATVAALCADGYSEQILLAHDANCCLDWIADPAAMAEQLPNWHFNHISDDVLPALRERGVSDAQIDTMLVANARRLFEQQGPY